MVYPVSRSVFIAGSAAIGALTTRSLEGALIGGLTALNLKPYFYTKNYVSATAAFVGMSLACRALDLNFLAIPSSMIPATYFKIGDTLIIPAIVSLIGSSVSFNTILTAVALGKIWDHSKQRIRDLERNFLSPTSSILLYYASYCTSIAGIGILVVKSICENKLLLPLAFLLNNQGKSPKNKLGEIFFSLGGIVGIGAALKGYFDLQHPIEILKSPFVGSLDFLQKSWTTSLRAIDFLSRHHMLTGAGVFALEAFGSVVLSSSLFISLTNHRMVNMKELMFSSGLIGAGLFLNGYFNGNINLLIQGGFIASGIAVSFIYNQRREFRSQIDRRQRQILFLRGENDRLRRQRPSQRETPQAILELKGELAKLSDDNFLMNKWNSETQIPSFLEEDALFKTHHCEILLGPLRNPVMDPTNHRSVYDLTAIKAALETNPRSPVTKQPLLEGQLIPMPALKALIDHRLEFHKQFDYRKNPKLLKENLKKPIDVTLEKAAALELETLKKRIKLPSPPKEKPKKEPLHLEREDPQQHLLQLRFNQGGSATIIWSEREINEASDSTDSDGELDAHNEARARRPDHDEMRHEPLRRMNRNLLRSLTADEPGELQLSSDSDEEIHALPDAAVSHAPRLHPNSRRPGTHAAPVSHDSD